MTVKQEGVLLDVSELTLSVPGERGPVPILTGVDLELRAGEALGVVGESGSGKSMTLRCIARLQPEGADVGGRITIAGSDVRSMRGPALRDLRLRDVATIFQDPRSAINPLQRIGDFVLEPINDTGGDVAAARRRARELFEAMGIPDPERRMTQYPFELSGGLLQRVMIAAALLNSPALLLADEPTTALDVTTQSDVLALTDALRRENGSAMVFVTHDLDLALSICDRVVVLYAGRLLEVGTAETIQRRPRHPYTRGLLGSRPPLETRVESLPVIEGTAVSAAEAGAGCPFVTRCPVAIARCSTELPEVTSYEGGEVRCHRADEIAAGLLDAGSRDEQVEVR